MQENCQSKTKAQGTLNTRWVEHHDALDRLIDLSPAVVDTLLVCSKLPNTTTPGTANGSSLLNPICNFEFVFCLITVRECLSLMQDLARSLQNGQLGVGCALSDVFVVNDSL